MRWRYLIFALLVGCATVNKTGPYGTGHDDSNTVNSLSNVNPALTTYGGSAYPSQIYNSLSKEDANRWSEQGSPFQNWVSTVANTNACLGAPTAGVVMTPTSCIAYNAGYRGTETGPITFPSPGVCWVAMDENTTGTNAGLPNFTRAPSTHYLIDCIDITQPALTADSQMLMKVTIAGGAITVVTDLRTKTPINGASSVTLAGDASGASGTNQVTSTHLSAALPANQGGTGIISPTAHGLLIPEGASPMVPLPLAVDTFPQGQGSSLDPTAGTLPTCANDGQHAWTYPSHTITCGTITAAIATHGQSLFTSSGTFTVPANVFSVTFEAWGPGGGGGGFGAAATNGSNGGAATTVIASATTYVEGDVGTGGTGTGSGAGTGGAAGFGTNGTFNIGGQAGFSGFAANGAVVPGGAAGRGDGGGGSGTCLGAGGSGGGGTGATGGGGGGGGGYSEKQVTTTPTSTFAVTIGTGGAAGTGGTTNGAAGCDGAVLVSW